MGGLNINNYSREDFSEINELDVLFVNPKANYAREGSAMATFAP